MTRERMFGVYGLAVHPLVSVCRTTRRENAALVSSHGPPAGG